MTYSHSNSDEIIPPVNLGSTGNPQMGIPPKPQPFLPLCPCKKPHLDSEMRTKGCAYQAYHNWFLFQKPIETYRNPEVDRIVIIFGPKKRGCRWKIKSQHGRNCLPWPTSAPGTLGTLEARAKKKQHTNRYRRVDGILIGSSPRYSSIWHPNLEKRS